VHQVGPKNARTQNFSFIAFEWEAAGVTQICVQLRQSDFFLLKSCFLPIKSHKEKFNRKLGQRCPILSKKRQFWKIWDYLSYLYFCFGPPTGNLGGVSPHSTPLNPLNRHLSKCFLNPISTYNSYGRYTV
jgi:hypothetical protein